MSVDVHRLRRLSWRGHWPSGGSGEGKMRRILMTAAAVIFFDTLLYGILIPLVPVYARDLDVSKATIGAIFAIYGIPLILLSAPLGILADRVGRARVLRGSMLLLA